MQEIEFSMMTRSSATAQDLQPLLDQFAAQHHVQVRLRLLSWESAWAELVKVALYSHGPDVSEIGTTWVGNLIAMNALRPFAASEIAACGGSSAYMPSAWQTGKLYGDQVLWAFPWLADTRVLYYRRDWLDQAGIDEQSAFLDHAQLEQTLARLQSSGIRTPWVVPSRHALTTLHALASWVWGAGGDFLSPDGRRLLFNELAARAGIRAYFNLVRYLSPEARDLESTQADGLFQGGKAATIISGPWVQRLLTPEVRPLVGVKAAPGVPFIGGSNLVVWRHTRQEKVALDFIHFLTSRDVQITCSHLTGLFPVRRDALESEAFANEPLYQAASESLKRGRSFPALTMWGLVEDKLSAELTQIWSSLLTHPELEVEATIAKHLDPLARRLSMTLSASGRG
jgi:multiple sugar transport system substrate-binding protein